MQLEEEIRNTEIQFREFTEVKKSKMIFQVVIIIAIIMLYNYFLANALNNWITPYVRNLLNDQLSSPLSAEKQNNLPNEILERPAQVEKQAQLETQAQAEKQIQLVEIPAQIEKQAQVETQTQVEKQVQLETPQAKKRAQESKLKKRAKVKKLKPKNELETKIFTKNSY
jgi:hypothetical protein